MTKQKHQDMSKDLEAKLMVESRRTCNLCWEKKLVILHHIIPVADGGENSEDNLILLCTECHSEVHSTRRMARNLNPTTLRLYKETWLDLVRRYPLLPKDVRQRDNDIDLIRGILRQADRRALYFPLDLEVGQQMFRSLDDFRIYIQSSGYRLLHDDDAKDHIRQIYKALLELALINPDTSQEIYCLYGALGSNRVDYLEIRRKTIRYHLNELARMIGLPNDLFPEDEMERMGLDILKPISLENAPPCFRRYTPNNPQCKSCDYGVPCEQATSIA